MTEKSINHIKMCGFILIGGDFFFSTYGPNETNFTLRYDNKLYIYIYNKWNQSWPLQVWVCVCMFVSFSLCATIEMTSTINRRIYFYTMIQTRTTYHSATPHAYNGKRKFMNAKYKYKNGNHTKVEFCFERKTWNVWHFQFSFSRNYC